MVVQDIIYWVIPYPVKFPSPSGKKRSMRPTPTPWPICLMPMAVPLFPLGSGGRTKTHPFSFPISSLMTTILYFSAFTDGAISVGDTQVQETLDSNYSLLFAGLSPDLSVEFTSSSPSTIHSRWRTTKLLIPPVATRSLFSLLQAGKTFLLALIIHPLVLIQTQINSSTFHQLWLMDLNGTLLDSVTGNEDDQNSRDFLSTAAARGFLSGWVEVSEGNAALDQNISRSLLLFRENGDILAEKILTSDNEFRKRVLSESENNSFLDAYSPFGLVISSDSSFDKYNVTYSFLNTSSELPAWSAVLSTQAGGISNISKSSWSTNGKFVYPQT